MKLTQKNADTDLGSEDATQAAMKEKASGDPEIAEPAAPEDRKSWSNVLNATTIGFGVLAAAVGALSAYALLQFQDTDHMELTQELGWQQKDIDDLRTEIMRIDAALASIGDGVARAIELEDEVDRIRRSSTDQSAKVRDQIAGLKTRVDDVTSKLDTLAKSIQGRFAELQDRPLSVIAVGTPEEAEQVLASSRLAEIEGRVDELRNRVTEMEASLEKIPSVDELASMTDILEAGIADLTVSSEIEEMVRANATRIAKLETASIGHSAASSLGLGIIAVRAAVEIGTPYSRIISDSGLSEDDLPTVVIEHAATGIVSASYLRDSFAGYARAALAAPHGQAVTEGNGNGGGLVGFLRSLFQVRPLSPRDGESLGAILSRAEAAVREDNIEDTLRILGTLPEASRAAMSEWIQAAESRIAVLNALDSLAGTGKSG